mgnify:CR=1 FL=1
MRRRLVVVFLVPLVGVLLVLGGAYAWSAARSIQQEHIAELLGDVAYFVTSARQALRSGSPDLVTNEAERYFQLYGTQVLVVDRSGSPWAYGGDEPTVLDEATSAQIQLALSGRRGELPEPVLPWALTDSVMVETVLDNGDAIGAVVITASVDVAREAILEQWALLLGGAILATSVGVFVVFRLANWVLGPVRRVDAAMEAIERGDVEARIADETGPPELRSMILIFNRMAQQIERVMARQQEFALNASHELRNPLSALLVPHSRHAVEPGPEQSTRRRRGCRGCCSDHPGPGRGVGAGGVAVRPHPRHRRRRGGLEHDRSNDPRERIRCRP